MKTKLKIIVKLSLCLGLSLPAVAAAPQSTSGDTVRNVWVFFKDKDKSQQKSPVSPRAELRRRKAGFRDSEGDRPVSGDYIREVERLGGTLRTTFRWGNAASFSVNPSRLSEISALPFVKSVSPVGTYINKKVDDNWGGGLSKSRSKSAAASVPGGYDWHTEAVNVPLAHDYIRYNGLGAPGSGVVMAFFDGGFRVDHAAYKRLRDSSQVIAAYDFVDRDTLVADPDSVVKNQKHPYHGNDRHGSQALSLAAAYAPDIYMGTAFGSSFLLARTENDAIEERAEEDNWLEAVLWADSIGADIISSSLGYRDGHTDSTDDWKGYQMDGVTTIISQAAIEAIKRGVIVVNAMGNDGNRVSGTLSAPADVDGVVSVGAVTQNRTLSDFSSIGPTSDGDGRMKPEVVAPGSYVPVPEPYSGDRASYTLVNGTSFSTPMVSAIMALILQTHRGISPEAAKKRLYASCSFAMGQNAANNRFGYGIPNAALAVMDSNEIFLKITDSTKKALTGAVVEFGGKKYEADTAGNILITTKKSALPAQLLISYRDSIPIDTVKVETLPFACVVELNKKWGDGLKVLPNVTTRENTVIKGRYTFSGAKSTAPVTITVRTLTGKKVWSQKRRLRPDGSVDFEWDVKSGGKGGAAAGVYIIMVRQGYSLISNRVIVSD